MKAADVIKEIKELLGVNSASHQELLDRMNGMSFLWRDYESLTSEQLATLERERPYFEAMERVRKFIGLRIESGPDEVADVACEIVEYTSELQRESRRFERRLDRVRHCECNECWREATEPLWRPAP